MYFGGWCWRKVAAPLRAAAHDVYAPSLTGCGDRVHLSRPGITIETIGRDIANLLRYEDLRDVTLVATSTGGMAVARAAELEAERIGHLVLVDALIPFAGLSAAQTVPALWAPIWQAGVVADTDAIESSQESVDRLLAQLDADDAEAVVHRRTTFPRAPMFEQADLRRFWQGGWPGRWCIASGRTTRRRRCSGGPRTCCGPTGGRSTVRTCRFSRTPRSWPRSSRSAAAKVAGCADGGARSAPGTVAAGPVNTGFPRRGRAVSPPGGAGAYHGWAPLPPGC